MATQLWQHDASLLMHAQELPYNLVKFIVSKNFKCLVSFSNALSEFFKCHLLRLDHHHQPHYCTHLHLGRFHRD